MLYHYTDRRSLAAARTAGRLIAKSTPLYPDLWGRGEPTPTGPVVWLTTSPDPDPTVTASMLAAGYPADLTPHLARVVLPADYPGAVDVPDYGYDADIPWECWRMLVMTARLAGADVSLWRVVPRDVPAADWLRCEVMTAPGVWGPAPER